MPDPEFKPPVAFYFRVKLLPNNKIQGAATQDTSFMEVSGISSKIETETIKDGGNYNSVKYLVNGFTYEKLKLKRGITPNNSNFAIWCNKNLIQNYTNEVITATLQVSLLKDNDNSFCAWQFFNAYPVSWNLEKCNSKSNEIAVENIEISYSYFRRLI